MNNVKTMTGLGVFVSAFCVLWLMYMVGVFLPQSALDVLSSRPAVGYVVFGGVAPAVGAYIMMYRYRVYWIHDDEVREKRILDAFLAVPPLAGLVIIFLGFYSYYLKM